MKKPDNKSENAVTVKVPEIISDPLKYKVLDDRPLSLTKEAAFAFLELETFPGERQVNERHVQSLYNQWAAGRFVWEHVIIATAKCGRSEYRINGQHTCWLRVNIPKPIEANVRLIEYQVPDEEQLRALYCVFDRSKSRTPGHIIRASLVGTTLAAELWPSTLGRVASGFKLWRFEKSANEMVEPSDIITLLEGEYNNLFRVVGVAWQELYENMNMRRSAVIAAMFATFSVSAKASLEFWQPVGTGLGLTNKTDPRYQLRKYFDNHSQSVWSARMGKKAASNEDFYRVSISAWNKWRKGEDAVKGLQASSKRIKPV